MEVYLYSHLVVEVSQTNVTLPLVVDQHHSFPHKRQQQKHLHTALKETLGNRTMALQYTKTSTLIFFGHTFISQKKKISGQPQEFLI